MKCGSHMKGYHNLSVYFIQWPKKIFRSQSRIVYNHIQNYWNLALISTDFSMMKKLLTPLVFVTSIVFPKKYLGNRMKTFWHFQLFSEKIGTNSGTSTK